MTAHDDVQARARWLEHLFDLDPAARANALASPDVPAEWRESGSRLCNFDDTGGVLDRNPARMVERLLGLADAHRAPHAEACVGRYRLEELIGEGGMATVWSARHLDERLAQQVAVKCLRTTLSTPDWQQRFLREQRILARLTHPNITRLYDAGISDAGVPYIVMERVHGRPVTEHCDQRRLDCRQRVRLFLGVCAAVAHAHHSLIVHRDLKPSNILVDDDGVPHLLDFGIAKMLDPTDVEAERTRTGFALLTPAYGAPEQFARGVITTATDVYGLGAILHELLTGTRARHLGDGRLQPPSSRATDLSAGIRGLASGRALRRVLRGDLDAIVERALRQEPELRYASAAELAADLQRWLDGEPVQTRTASLRYRADKFMRRHWLVLGVVVLTVLGLSASTAISLRESARAEQEARRARITRDFVLELMRDLRPGAAMNSPHRLLDRAAQLARGRFSADEETRAALLAAVAELDRGYGRLPQAQALLLEASRIARALHGSRSEPWLQAEASLGHTAMRLGDYRAGTERLAAALHDYDAAGGVDGEARIGALIHLGQLRQHLGDNVAALRLQREAYELSLGKLEPGHWLRQAVLEMYGEALAQSGELEKARDVLRQNLELARARFGDPDLAVASALETLALREIELGNPEAARRQLLEARGIAAAAAPGPHAIAAYVDNSLGVAEQLLGRPAQAQRAYQAALDTFAQLYVAPHPMLAATHSNLGHAAFERADYAGAAAHFAEAARQRDAMKARSPSAGMDPRCLAGEARAAAGYAVAARAELEPCLRTLQQAARPNSDYLAAAHAALAAAHWRGGDAAAAAAEAEAALAFPPPVELHERLTPLRVLAQIAATADDPAGVRRQVEAALAASEHGERSRPCTIARDLQGLATLAHDAGDAALSQRVRKVAQATSCDAGDAEIPRATVH